MEGVQMRVPLAQFCTVYGAAFPTMKCAMTSAPVVLVVLEVELVPVSDTELGSGRDEVDAADDMAPLAVIEGAKTAEDSEEVIETLEDMARLAELDVNEAEEADDGTADRVCDDADENKDTGPGAEEPELEGSADDWKEGSENRVEVRLAEVEDDRADDAD
jgi:hypothetical protein